MVMNKNMKNKYLQLIKKDFSNIHYKNIKIITKWWSNDVVILDDIIFRFPKEDFVRNNFIKEIKILEILNKEIKNIQVPKYTYISKNNDFWWYQIIKWVEFKKSYINNSNYKNIAMQIGTFLNQLHSIDINKFQNLLNLDVNKHYSFETWYINYIIWEYKKIEYLFSKEDFQKIISFIQNTQNYKINYSSLTHYDFQWKNIIISEDKNKINWIIDFSDIAIYDPAIDFVWLLWFSKKFLNEVLKNYKIDNWQIIERAKYYKNKWLIFTFPEIYKKNWNLKQLRKIEKIIKNF